MGEKHASNFDFFVMFSFGMSLFFALILFYINFPQNTIFCDSDFKSKKMQRCIPCPSRAKCLNGIATCNDNYTLIHKFCLNIENDHKKNIILSEFLEISKLLLREKAGSYECDDSSNDWMSPDDIENSLYSILKKNAFLENHNISYSNFILLLNETLLLLKEENDIKTIDIQNSSAFVANDSDKTLKCIIQKTFYKYAILGLVIFLGFIYAYYINTSKKLSQSYKIKADQILSVLVRYIKSYNGFEISNSHLKEKMSYMVAENEKKEVWKFVKAGLENSKSIIGQKRNGEIYYKSII